MVGKAHRMLRNGLKWSIHFFLDNLSKAGLYLACEVIESFQIAAMPKQTSSTERIWMFLKQALTAQVRVNLFRDSGSECTLKANLENRDMQRLQVVSAAQTMSTEEVFFNKILRAGTTICRPPNIHGANGLKAQRESFIGGKMHKILDRVIQSSVHLTKRTSMFVHGKQVLRPKEGNSMKRGNQRHRYAPFVVTVVMALGLLVPSRLSGQVAAANISGTVYDQAGAVIPGDKVTLANVATGVARTTIANDVGRYVFTDIMPGNYTLEVSKEGFASSKLNPFNLEVSQSTTFDFKLGIGSAAAQTVQVTASGADLQTSSSELGTVIDAASTASLPLDGRNFTQLLTLTAGASPANVSQNSGGFVSGQTFGSFSIPAVNGQTNRSNFFLLDGMDDQQSVASMYTIQPILDDIQEFKVVSHTDQAQYGGVLGGIINVATKSGTNLFHGAAWEYLRNSAFDAKNPFTPATTPITPLHQNQFGANIGGPVLLPHYNGRNRTFFFGSYEGIRINTAALTLFNVPTPTELTGNLSNLTGEQIYNPYSTASNGSRQPFMCDSAGNPTALNPDKTQVAGVPCNILPSGLIDPNMVKVAKAIYPAPVNTGNPNFNGIDTSPSIAPNNEYSIRIDEQLGAKDAFWWRFTHTNAPTSSSGGFPGLVSATTYFAYQEVAGWRHTFGQSSVLDVSFGRDKGSDSSPTLLANVNGQALSAAFSPDFACGFSYSPHSCLLPGFKFDSGNFVGGGESNTYSQISHLQNSYSRVN